MDHDPRSPRTLGLVRVQFNVVYTNMHRFPADLFGLCSPTSWGDAANGVHELLSIADDGRCVC